jgi:hypothetical protein
MTKLELTSDQIKVIGAALQELPMKVAAPVWMAIQKQLIAQSIQVPAPVAEDEPKDE